ncbi:MAG TPA: flagellar protein, partial [Mariprofundaceae bacterium]|nr:flagellar protein [Mariprofundaceae bacterium]
LATQAASANNSGELGKLDAERIKLESAIDKIAGSTKYNGVNLLDGTSGSTASLGAAVTGVSTTVATNGAAAGAVTLATLTNGGGIDITLTNAGGTSQTVNVTVPSAGTTSDVTFGDIGLTLTVDSNLVTGGAGTITVTGGASSNFQVGADNDVNNRVSLDLSNSYTTAGLSLTGDLTTQANAQTYIDTAKAALDTLITQRADLGATQNQISFIQSNLATSIEQTTASVSSIRDADMAAEMAEFTKNQILTQASTSMLAQANQAAQNVMTLFR